jgi:hypothetical protein
MIHANRIYHIFDIYASPNSLKSQGFREFFVERPEIPGQWRKNGAFPGTGSGAMPVKNNAARK